MIEEMKEQIAALDKAIQEAIGGVNRLVGRKEELLAWVTKLESKDEIVVE